MSLYVNKRHILYSQPVSSSKLWMCLWTTHHYILKKKVSTFVCLCNIFFNSVNCLCLVESDCKVRMILDYFRDIYNGADSWFLCTCTHESLHISVFLRTGLQLLILIWYLMLVFESSRIARAIVIVMSHIPSQNFWLVPLAVDNFCSKLFHILIVLTQCCPWARYCASINWLTPAEPMYCE